MSRKPNDMLEFLRRGSDEPAPSREVIRESPRERREFLPETMVVRRSQLLISAAVALLLVVLAFAIGLNAGTGPDNAGSAGSAAPAEVWVLRAVALKDTENNRVVAKAFQLNLRDYYTEEILVHPLEEQGLLILTVGAWLRNPENDPEEYKAAIEMRDQIRKAQDEAGTFLFSDAYFWKLTR